MELERSTWRPRPEHYKVMVIIYVCCTASTGVVRPRDHSRCAQVVQTLVKDSHKALHYLSAGIHNERSIRCAVVTRRAPCYRSQDRTDADTCCIRRLLSGPSFRLYLSFSSKSSLIATSSPPPNVQLLHGKSSPFAQDFRRVDA
jgi:hypothetical protein